MHRFNLVSALPRETQKVMQVAKSICKWDNSPHQVYFIGHGDDGPIKIGTSRDTNTRLKALQTASPMPLQLLASVGGSYQFEHRLHKLFEHESLGREWFRRSDRLMMFIAAVTRK